MYREDYVKVAVKALKKSGGNDGSNGLCLACEAWVGVTHDLKEETRGHYVISLWPGELQEAKKRYQAIVEESKG